MLLRTVVIDANSNLVINVVEFEGKVPSDPLPGQIWVTHPEAEIGWLYQGRGRLVPPVVEVPDVAETKNQVVRGLKDGMRRDLMEEIGDWGDNLADLERTIALQGAIASGAIVDEAVIKRMAGYCAGLLEGYGGVEAVLGALEKNLRALRIHVFSRYYPAKQQVMDAKDPEEAKAVVMSSVKKGKE